MTKHYVDKKLTVAVSITNAGTLTDPTSVSFKYRINRDGTETTASVTNTATGVYEADITPTEPGILYGTWETTGTPTVTIPVVHRIYDKHGWNG